MSNETVVPVEVGGERHKPLNMLEAVSEIQRYSVAESGGSNIPKDYFTLDMQMEYFMLGFKSVLHGGLFTILFMPVLMGVLMDKVHLFGHAERTMLDTVYMFAVTLMFSLAYVFFYGYAATFNAGEITKRMLANLYAGVSIGSIIKAMMSVVVYHLLYFMVFTDLNVYAVLNKLSFISADIRTKIFYWIQDAKEVLISSSLWIFFICIAYIAACWVFYFRSENKKKTMEKGYGRK